MSALGVRCVILSAAKNLKGGFILMTIKEIAMLAGVSRGTVDRVLNNRGAVKPETARRILNIAETVGYSPNLAGKTLAARKKNLKFGYILFSGTSSNLFFKDMRAGIESRIALLKEYGACVEIREVKFADPEAQVFHIDELAALGIDGLVITPIAHPEVIKRLRMMSENNIPVVTANSDVCDSGRLCYVGSDYHKSGETAAGLMNMLTNGNAGIGIIGAPWAECHHERMAGFVKQIDLFYPGLSVISIAENNNDDIESYAVTTSMLKTHPEIDALYLTAAGVVGACRAVQNMGLEGKVRIVSNDATTTTRELVENGVIAATITQQPFTQGAKPLEILLDYVGMGIAPDEEYYYTKIEIKIKENL